MLPHYTIDLFPHELEISGEHDHGSGVTHASHDLVFVLGRSVPFLVVLGVSAYLTSLVAERLRRSDRRLRESARTLMLQHQRLERVVESSGVGMMLVEPDLSLP